MRSTVAITYEMDDMEKAAEELVSKVTSSLPLQKNSLGLLFCDTEVDVGSLLSFLKKKLTFDIIGCMSIAVIDGEKGYNEMAVGLMVLTADDVSFVPVLSEPYAFDNVVAAVSDAYKRGTALLKDKPQLVMLMAPINMDVVLDDYVEAVDAVSGGVPVFGGISTWNPPYGASGVFINDGLRRDQLLLVLVEGNIKPIFAIENVVNAISERKSLITSAKRNLIYQVNGMTFVQYLSSIGIPVTELANSPVVLSAIVPPLLLDMNNEKYNDGIPVLRTIGQIYLDDGHGVSAGKVPQGAYMTAVSVNKKDIAVSVRRTMDDIVQKIKENEEDGYRYSTIFCVSCHGRHITLASDKAIEGNIIAQNMPAGVNAIGFYGYGEICPTSVCNGEAVNRAHNVSFVLCAF